MQLSRLASVSRDVAATRSRLEKSALLSGCLTDAAKDEIRLVVSYLAGMLPQGRIGLGPGIVRDIRGQVAAGAGALDIREVDETFSAVAAMGGQGSQAAKRDALGRLFARATAEEQDFLARLILGELRQGALEGVLVDAISEAYGVPVERVRRAAMLAGDLAPVAAAAMTAGEAGLADFALEPFRPVQPMLAQPAADVDEAMASLGEAALEYKLDGARVQVHKVGRDVQIFSRRLNDVTASLPEVVEAIAGLPSASLVADGEVLAMGGDGRPQPFQVTMRRFGRKAGVAGLSTSLPLSLFLFDALYADGEALIDLATRDRHARLEAIAGPSLRVPRRVTADAGVAAAFLGKALADGHEGLMAKSLAAPYAAGSRGGEWLKIKEAHTLDLVILAAEWGSGRRQGMLSNLHLGARDPDTGGFVMLGKTFKGLTDSMLEWQTKRLLGLEIGREGHVVHVAPELVAEIAVNDIQTSPQYPAGMALRFARVKRYRPDKSASEADTLGRVRELHERQASR